MSSDLEKIPLEVFHRHIVITHLKDQAARALEEVEKEAGQSSEPFGTLLAEWVRSQYPKELHFQEDNWYAMKIPVDECYFAHAQFRGYPVPKNERFVDFMPRRYEEIESGLFPYSSEIRGLWSGPMWEPLARERDPRKYYILDGELRVIWHWYHKVPNLRVFVYKGKLRV